MKSFAVIMAGGSGTRFWPYSTKKCPKQYLKLTDEALIVSTYKRLSFFKERFIVTAKNQLKLAKKTLKAKYIVEPDARNTAACIFFSMIHLIKNGAKDEDVVAFFPSDHLISTSVQFANDIKKGIKLADQGMVTIGIKPTFPNIGFGYIKKGKKNSDGYKIEAFLEKPNLKLAKKYFKSKDYFWNAGIFIVKIKDLKESFKKLAPSFYNCYHKFIAAKTSNVSKLYQKLPKISFDYLIMEKIKNAFLVPSHFYWNDLGSWDAMNSVLPKKDDNYINVKKLLTKNASNNIVFAPNQKVAMINIKDLIVVSINDTILILPRKDSQLVKDVSDD